ncbi:MAG: PBSX family phage terminase large subunit [Oscillospiraceae bacterium]|nr:PBSX family phage terminase large subunit [Oscillospiraceae bacterium]
MKHRSHRMNPASLENLKKCRPFTSETAPICARMAQAKGVETKKKMKNAARMVAMMGREKIPDHEKDIKERLTALGIKEEDQTVDTMVAFSLLNETRTGNVAAIRTWFEYSGDVDPDIEPEESDPEQMRAILKANYFDSIDSYFASLGSKALNHIYTHYDVRGGRGSTKSSWASLTVVTLVMLNPDVHALVLRKVARTLLSSVFSQYRWAIDQLGVGELWEVKSSTFEMIFKPTGQKILFRGADNPMKLKSIKTEFGYIGITHFEEKDQFSGRQEIDSILQSTMRGGEKFWNIETCNPPRSRNNWVNRDCLEERADRILHQSSYLDLDHPEEWLGETFLAEAESLKQRDENRYKHEYLGIPVGVGGNVFENIEERTITDEEIRRFDRIFQGVDWGWFPDQYAFIRLHYDKTRETIYLLDENYGNRMSNEETAEWIRERGYDGVETVCDTAERKSIADYRSLGVNAKEARKGPGSVEYGMKWLQHRTIVIDRRRTPHAYEEFTRYEFEKNRDGEWISGYPDRDNHLIDATRYALERVSLKYRSHA